jgi:membrane-associated phospholipid phosphatase
MSPINRRQLLATTLLTTGTVAATAAGVGVRPAAALPRDFDHVQYWNDVLLRAFRKTTTGGGAPTVLSRAAAMLNLALHDTCVSFGSARAPYIGKVARIPNFNYDLDMNLDAAAYKVLRSVLPDVDFAPDFTTARSYPPLGEPGPEGYSVNIGEGAAQQILQARTGDGSAAPVSYPGSTVPGQWRPTGSGAAVTAHWGSVRPFAVSSATQFRPPLPGGFATAAAMLASPEYAAQVNEVKDLGGLSGSRRSTEQTRIAFFWANDLAGTYKPPGQLLQHTKIIAQGAGITGSALARLYALVSMAMADAGITAWSAKYDTAIGLWRPETAIQLAGQDDNPATETAAGWQPLSQDRGGNPFTPPFPSYISGHATFAGAWAGVLRAHFGTDDVAFTATTEDPHAVGATRTFSSLLAAAKENARSRVYLGVHYQWDADAGLSAGTGLGAWIVANTLR